MSVASLRLLGIRKTLQARLFSKGRRLNHPVFLGPDVESFVGFSSFDSEQNCTTLKDVGAGIEGIDCLLAQVLRLCNGLSHTPKT